MREIKFRAWDIVDEVMREVLKIDFDLKVVWLLKYVNGEKRAYELEFKDIELMQLTGLHDKNGKGIYEGDRMQIQQGYYKALRNRDIELEVVFNHGSFVLKNDKFETPIDTTGEVIGNIYENPELLKEDK